MKLIEDNNCYRIKNFFSPSVICGFTKSNLKGDLPNDINNISLFSNLIPQISYMNQEHGSKVHIVKKQGVYVGDAIFTSCANNLLVVRTADCLPIIFCENDSEKIGVLHMGWRSAKEAILDNIPYSLENFKVVLGAGLRKCCFEVKNEFLTNKQFKPFIYTRENKLFFDSIGFATKTLILKGVRKEAILDLGICSFCSSKSLFSYRRDKTYRRTLSFILHM